MSGNFLDEESLFKRAFKPVGDGYVYYPHRWSKGYPLSVEERDAVLKDWEGMQANRFLLPMLVAYLIVAMALHTGLEWVAGEPVSKWYSIIPSAFALCGYLYQRALKPVREITSRKPIAPPRDFS